MQHFLYLTLVEVLGKLLLELLLEGELRLSEVAEGVCEFLRLQTVQIELVAQELDLHLGSFLKGHLAFLAMLALLVFFFTLGLSGLCFLCADVCRKNGSQRHDK